jgi:hypothetical protein
MSFLGSYTLLFEATILHGYFLNDGETAFDAMTDENKIKMLSKYKHNSFIEVNPTIETVSLLRNLKLLYKKDKTGFSIYSKVDELDPVEPFVDIPASLKLDFTMRTKDYQFENYTDLEFSNTKLFYFSNVKPTTEPITFKYIPKFGDPIFISNEFMVSEKTSSDVLSSLDFTETKGLFGIISIVMTGDSAANSVLTPSGKLKTLGLNFKIHFDNRKTFWKYINKKTPITVETNSAKPLTNSGFVEIDPSTDFTPAAPAGQYPNPTVKSITKIASKIYSEIFI